MSVNFLSVSQIKLIVTGVVLMLTVSLATAAIVMWLPESPVYSAPVYSDQLAHNMNEYVQLHEARNALVPHHMGIQVGQSTQ